MHQKALIYCRVSSERQKKEGHGLDSQEQRCRQYAFTKGYEVEQVFQDSSSGGGDFMNRPAMRELINYLDKKAHNPYVVVFDDLKRFARDTVFHLKLRQELNARKAKIECLNFRFDETPEGEFIEIILAAQGELERKQNKRQVIQKQKARLERGYWPFFPPPGYKTTKDPVHGKLLIPDEPQAGIITEALEGFASGRLPSQVDVQRFLQSRDFCDGKPVYLEKVKRLLSRLIYSGYIEYPEWEVSRRKGHHKTLISLETHEKIIEKLYGKRKFPHVRKDVNTDFPLRGFVLCSKCHEPYTASWSTGRNDRFPYYRCKTVDCTARNKSIRKEILEGELEVMLCKLKPLPQAISLAKAIMLSEWNKRLLTTEQRCKDYKNELSRLQDDIRYLLERASKTQNERAALAYEARVEELTKRELILQEKINKPITPNVKFEIALDTVFGFLENPYFKWENGDTDNKRLVLKLVFAEKLIYDREKGFGTADLSLPLRVFELFQAPNSQLVEMVKKTWNRLEKFISETYEFLQNREAL